MNATDQVRILDGSKCSTIIQEQLQKIADSIRYRHQIAAGLDVLLIGDSPASLSYVTGKKKAAEKVGIAATIHHYPPSMTLEQGLEKLREIQHRPSCNGILVQLPLPDSWHSNQTISPTMQIVASIRASKDVDGFAIENQGHLLSNHPYGLKPCTPMGILALLRAYGLQTQGKNVCVIGRSSIVGNPISHLLAQKPQPDLNLGLGNATVIQCNSYTPNLKQHCQQADIIISAAGRPNLIAQDMVQPGCTVVDVGISRVEDASRKRGFRLVGDVDFAAVAPKCRLITPVPGGIGPMTITMLLYNTIQAACQQNNVPMPSLDWQEVQQRILA